MIRTSITDATNYGIDSDMLMSSFLDGLKIAVIDMGLWKYLLLALLLGTVGMVIKVKLARKTIDKEVDRQVDRQVARQKQRSRK